MFPIPPQLIPIITLIVHSLPAAVPKPLDDPEIDRMSAIVQKDLNDFLQETDWEKTKQTLSAWKKKPVGYRVELVRQLQRRLDNQEERRVTNYADMFVLSRVRSGKQAFHGHGEMMEQDVFTTNGLCAYAIERVLGCSLPHFSTEDNASVLKEKIASANEKIHQQLHDLD